MGTYPQQSRLDIIVNCARVAVSAGMTAEAALAMALTSVSIDCTEALGRTGAYATEMTADRREEWAELDGVVRDIRNGFVSPVVGNVRDYALTLIRGRALAAS